MKVKAQLVVTGMLLATIGTGIGQPVITIQPQTQTNCVGATAVFIVEATGTGALSYQWQGNFGSGFNELTYQTNRTLTLAGLVPSLAGDYRVVVGDSTGTTNSDVAQLYLFAAPMLTAQPTPFSTASLGATVANRVGASGSFPLSFQWRLNGEPIPGQTFYSITLTNVQLSNAGTYDVVISNYCGSITSRVSTLTVLNSGFERVLQPGWTNRSCYSWSVAWGDYNGDSYPDLHVCNASSAGGPFVDFIYRNNGANTNVGPFTQMTSNEVGEAASDVAISASSAWIDVNNDGLLDLAVCRSPQNISSGAVSSRIYLNQGNGRLASVPANTLTRPTFAYGGAWGDFNNDGLLDFHQMSAYALDPAAWPVIRTNRLFLGKPDLVFEEIKNSAVCTSQTDNANSSSWCDYDNDGDLDLVVVNGSRPTFWFQNQGNGNFVRITNAVTRITSALYNSAWGDYDNDGDLDLLITGERSLLFRNDYPQDFVNVADFGDGGYPVWADYDNDGLLDFVIFRGQGSDMENRLYHNNGDGTFTRVSDPVTTSGRWVVGAWADYDNDGFMDLFITSAIGLNALYHNRGGTNHWIKFSLKGTVSNAAAIGAKVRVKARIRGQTVWQMREVSAGGWPQDDMRPNFGLGDATMVDLVRVEWPSGTVQELANYSADRTVNLIEPSAIVPARPTTSLGGSVTLVSSQIANFYQWCLYGTNLVGQTNRLLTLTNLTTAGAGPYSVVVTLSGGVTRTNFTYLYVDTQFTKITADPVAADKLTGSGLVWGDYDGDGNVDLLVFNDPGTGARSTNILYRNQGNGTFARVNTTPFQGEQGAYAGGLWADFNNDGWLDFYVPDAIRWYSSLAALNHLLYLGGAGGSFTRRSSAPTDAALTLAWDATCGDFDNDGLVDLFVLGAWVDRATRNQLFRNTGNGTFARITQGPVVTDSANSELVAASDYDGDGDLDLLVSSHSQRLLYRNDGNWSFTRITTGPIALDNGNSAGPAWGDYDNDGRMDLCLATFDDTLHLFHNEGQGVFVRTVLGPISNYQVPAWGDYDNDGWLDLFVTHGNGSGQLRNRLYRNNGDGTFTEVRAGSVPNEGGYSIACAWADYDNNGFLDLVVGNGYKPITNNFLYRNNGNGNRWLLVRLVGTTSNRSAIGAKVRVRATIFGRNFWQLREITAGGCRAQSDLRAHFGLGDATVATTLKIEWPSGIVQQLNNVAANQILTVVEPLRPVVSVTAPGGGILMGDTNQTYQLFFSEDLMNWTPMGGVTTDSRGAGTWTDPGATGSSKRFYKARGL